MPSQQCGKMAKLLQPRVRHFKFCLVVFCLNFFFFLYRSLNQHLSTLGSVVCNVKKKKDVPRINLLW